MSLMDAQEVAPQEIPDYILNACQAAGEWWAKSDQDPRIKFQPQVVYKLLTAVREGMHYEPACALAGVTYTQFRNWMNRGEDEGPETPHGVVACALKVAEAEAEGETVRYVRAASRLPQFWAAGMTFLERRHPDRWKRPDASQSVQVNVGVALGVQASPEQLRTLAAGVQIAQIPNVNGVLPSGQDTELSPLPESLSTPSPTPEIAVTVDNGEAKATPNRGVSPPNVA